MRLGVERPSQKLTARFSFNLSRIIFRPVKLIAFEVAACKPGYAIKVLGGSPVFGGICLECCLCPIEPSLKDGGMNVFCNSSRTSRDQPEINNCQIEGTDRSRRTGRTHAFHLEAFCDEGCDRKDSSRKEVFVCVTTKEVLPTNDSCLTLFRTGCYSRRVRPEAGSLQQSGRWDCPVHPPGWAQQKQRLTPAVCRETARLRNAAREAINLARR